MIDLEKLRLFYQFGREISLADLQFLIKNAQHKRYEPNEYLIKEGSYQRDVFFIRKGIVRIFRINDKGEEITTQLRWENHIFVDTDMIILDSPSQVYCQAIEATEVLSMNFDTLQKIVEKNPKLERNRKYMLRKVIEEMHSRINDFVLLSPEERYLKYIKEHPEIINRVPNKYIANVLGITPVSLSRIRKRIAEKRS